MRTDEIWAFVGVELARSHREALARVIKDAERAGARCPAARDLALAIEDLGEVRQEALEAVRLAVSRVTADRTLFGVKLRGVDVWPAEAPRVVRVLVDDPEGRLAELRAAVHEALRGYGFEAPEGDWRPHIAVGLLGEGADVRGLVDPGLALGALKIRRLAVFRWGERGFQSEFQAPLLLPGAAAPAAPEEDRLRAEITAELDERLSQRVELSAPMSRPRRRRTAGWRQQEEEE